MEAFLTQIGIHMPDLFAGFAGGLVAALVVSGSRPSVWSIFSSIVVGMFAGGYFGPLVPGWLPNWLALKASPGVSFGTGLAGMPLCRGIIAATRRVKWTSTGDKNV